MGKVSKKITALVLALALLFSGSALAYSVDKALGEPKEQSAQASGTSPLKVEITSKKDKYFISTVPEFTVTVTNTGTATVNNISARVSFNNDSIRPLGGDSKLAEDKTSLAPGASFSFSFKAGNNSFSGIDFLFMPLWAIMRWTVGNEIPVPSDILADAQASRSVKFTGIFTSYDYLITAKVKHDAVQPPVDNQFKFTSFTADTTEIIVGEKKQVTFTAKVETNLSLTNSDIGVYDADTGAFVSWLQNKGNGVFAWTVEMSSDKEETARFLARYGGYTSSAVAVRFYKRIDPNNIYFSPINDTNLEYANGIPYANNEVIFYAHSGVQRNEIETIIQGINGQIVGYMEPVNLYQVRFSSPKTLTELNNTISMLNSLPQIDFSSLNMKVTTKNDIYYPADDWNGASWDENSPAGENWGVEAIKAPSAWEHRNKLQPTNVGLIDTKVDFEHDDLSGTETNATSMASFDTVGHGTHVAGTIAALMDNGITPSGGSVGVTGVAPNANLFGYNSGDLASDDVLSHVAALNWLIAVNRVKVINFSRNNGRLECFAADRGNVDAQNYFNLAAAIVNQNLSVLLESNDFLIVSSAGNVNNKRFVEDTSARYGWRESQDETGESGDVGCFYNNFFNVITDSDVRRHILVVGSIALDTNGGYRQSEFSNLNPDVFAPGEDIYSTLPNNRFGALGGTSMAAPHVSGLATMIWGAKPDLHGNEVKDIILSTAGVSIEGNIKLIDAKKAIEKALAGKISGAVVDSENNNAPMQGVTVNAYEYDGSRISPVATTTTNASGQFELTLPEGKYELQFVYAPEYGTIWRSTPITPIIERGEWIMLFDPIVMYKEGGGGNTFAGGNGTAENPYLISNPVQLDAVRNDLTAHYKMINDIDLAGWGDWEPIGHNSGYFWFQTTPDETSFRGIFDGGGHVVKSMRISNTEKTELGLFGAVNNGTIKNLGIANGNIDMNTDENYYGSAGGVVGYTSSSTISNCYYSGNINTSVSGSAGGLGLIRSVSYVGGIVGNAKTTIIVNCYNIGNISTYAYNSAYAGGIVGDGSPPSNCYSVGNISGTYTHYEFSVPPYYFVVPYREGGIAGETSSAMNNCYYLNTIAVATYGKDDNSFSNVLSLTPVQMKQQSSFVGFDFTNTWAINPSINNGYPYLRGMQP